MCVCVCLWERGGYTYLYVLCGIRCSDGISGLRNLSLVVHKHTHSENMSHVLVSLTLGNPSCVFMCACHFRVCVCLGKPKLCSPFLLDDFQRHCQSIGIWHGVHSDSEELAN